MPFLVSDVYIYIAAGLILVTLLIIILIVTINRSRKAEPLDINQIKNAFGKDNIKTITFVRNKINVTLDDVKKADMNALKDAGAVGINIIGDKVKCYFNDDNEAIFDALKASLKE
ncbi:MAG: hypothetical protein ACOC1L_06685 [Bacillota bacterium]